MALGPVRRQVSPHAARLRRDKTDCEQRFWLAVRDRRLGGFKFRFQHSFYPRVADFVCLEAGLVVELDGGQHEPGRDARRTAELEARGLKVLRFWNSDVIENLPGVLETVLAACHERTARSPLKPSPAVAGEEGPAGKAGGR